AFCGAACLPKNVLVGFLTSGVIWPASAISAHIQPVRRSGAWSWHHGRGIMQSARRAKKTPVTLLAASIAFALQAQASVALAQDVAPAEQAETLDTIVVTGYRASLERAMDIKRGEAGMVDAIVAEDIADFPDLNLAESLQRIPGVSITREGGEGRNISVRG